MGIQPSASKTTLLLACPRPFDPALESEPDISGEPARYGSAFHQVLASCLRADTTGKKKPLERTDRYAREIDRAAAAHDVRGAREELAGHVKSSAQVLRNWLTREKLEVAEVETAYAILPGEGKGGTWGFRKIEPHDENHVYDIESDELGATVDLIARNANRSRTVVVDHKTGAGDTDGFAQPALIPQMRTLGLLAPKAGAEVGIFHADRRGLPIVYAEPYDPLDQRRHAVSLRKALALVGQGFLRSGPHCGRCPERVSCPAHTADLLAESTTALVASANTLAIEPINPRGILLPPENGSTLETRAGALYEVLKRFRVLEKAGSDEIRRLVKAGAVIETREGKVLTLQTQTYETLSMKSVREALGKVEGEKMLSKLRAKGAVRETTREMLKGE